MNPWVYASSMLNWSMLHDICTLHTLVLCMLNMIGCIAFELFLYTCISWFGLGIVKPSMRIERSSHFEWWNLSPSSSHQDLWLTHDKVLDFIFCVACISIKTCNLGSLDYHASNASLMALEPRVIPPWVPKHDRRQWPCLHVPQNPCHALLSCCCCQSVCCRDFLPAGSK